jgi:imidazolonepropionase-like amidohydrolase
MRARKNYFAAALLLCSVLSGVAHAEVLVITGARVHTMGDQGTLHDATVLVENDRIVAVGNNVDIPDGATLIDASGRVVTPGFFDAYSYFGVAEISLIEQTVDVFQSDDRYTASFELGDVINPRSTLIPINRIEGVTRAMVAPHSRSTPEPGASPITGLGTVIHLGSTENFIVARNSALFVELGETGAALSGGSRANTLLLLREALQDARDLATNRSQYEQGARRSYRLSRFDLEVLISALNGQIPLVASVHRASDIEAALRLADEFGIRLIINGGAEAWVVAEKLSLAQVPVILDPLNNLPGSFESLGSTLENSARLEAAGVTVAFSSGNSHNSRNMKQAAGVAVANGLDYEAALKALTINPARMYGVDEKYGTIAPGMDADLVVWSGDPLEVTTFADMVLIKGRLIPMVSRSTLLFERYKELGGEWPPAYRN